MFSKIEANRLQISDDYKNTVDSLAVRPQVDESSDPSSVTDAIKAGFALYQSQNARIEHPVLREQPQYLLVDDKEDKEPTPLGKFPDEKKSCADVYAPVCGDDGVTYGNSCEAKLYGVAHWTDGECHGGDKWNEPGIELPNKKGQRDGAKIIPSKDDIKKEPDKTEIWETGKREK